MSDEEIERNARMDPDNPPAPAGWPEAGTLRRTPNKVPISIRVDADVLDFFRKQGEGYQSRMNAVLRYFMEHALVCQTRPQSSGEEEVMGTAPRGRCGFPEGLRTSQSARSVTVGSTRAARRDGSQLATSATAASSAATPTNVTGSLSLTS
jgi:uncharacterized protein (DUF4415 family)